jgi:hypothetical protein
VWCCFVSLSLVLFISPSILFILKEWKAGRRGGASISPTVASCDRGAFDGGGDEGVWLGGWSMCTSSPFLVVRGEKEEGGELELGQLSSSAKMPPSRPPDLGAGRSWLRRQVGYISGHFISCAGFLLCMYLYACLQLSLFDPLWANITMIIRNVGRWNAHTAIRVHVLWNLVGHQSPWVFEKC